MRKRNRRDKRFGDRPDGRLIRSLDPFYKLIPYIMKSRDDSQTFFDEQIDMTHLDQYIRTKRETDMKNLGFLHIVMAAYVRTISQKPALNRFIAGQKIYSRKEISISLAVKKQLIEDSPETTIKFKFEPTDTLYDVVNKVNVLIDENKKLDTSNGTDKTARLLLYCPGFFIKFFIWGVSKLDYIGFMPSIINQVSPFHCSAFVTDLGSVGIQPVYHHLYNFGTTSQFIAFGAKKRIRVVGHDGIVTERKYINLKVVTDERIADGYTYANAFRYFRSLITHPERLEVPPETVVQDVE